MTPVGLVLHSSASIRVARVAAGSNRSEIKMDAVEACHVDDHDVHRQFVDVFTEYLNAYSRDASESESEIDDDGGGDDEQKRA